MKLLHALCHDVLLFHFHTTFPKSNKNIATIVISLWNHYYDYLWTKYFERKIFNHKNFFLVLSLQKRFFLLKKTCTSRLKIPKSRNQNHWNHLFQWWAVFRRYWDKYWKYYALDQYQHCFVALSRCKTTTVEFPIKHHS